MGERKTILLTFYQNKSSSTTVFSFTIPFGEKIIEEALAFPLVGRARPPFDFFAEMEGVEGKTVPENYFGKIGSNQITPFFQGAWPVDFVSRLAQLAI